MQLRGFSKWSWPLTTVAVLAAVLPAGVRGGEVAGLVGGMKLKGIPIKPVVGASVGGNLSKRLLLYAEFAHYPLLSESYRVRTGANQYETATVKARVLDGNCGVNVKLLTGQRVVPYVSAGLGLDWNSVSSNFPQAATQWGYFLVGGSSDADLTARAGLGARFYVGRNWGLKPEAQYVRKALEAGGDGLNGVRLTFGVFYEFGK